METIPLPETDMLPMDHIADDVKGLRVIFTNVFGITAPNGDWALVDAALPGSGGRIRNWAEEHFGNAKPASIILTHGHFDHTGALDDLLEHWPGIPVYAHELEMPYLTGQTSYPPPDPGVGGGMMALMSPLYPRSPKNLGDRVKPISADGIVPGFSAWRWLHTPGHTRGHISLFRDSDRTLLVGDAFCTTNSASFFRAAIDQEPKLAGPPPYYTPDWDQARDSVRKLAALQPSVVAPGHGRPMQGPVVAAALENLAANFDQMARPEHGKQAHQS